RDMRPVVVVVHWVAGRGDDVVAVCAGRATVDRPRATPHVCRKVRVVVIDTGVDDAHDDTARPGGAAPGRVGTDRLHPPELAVVLVVWARRSRVRVDDVIGLGVANLRLRLQKG